jgi:hypothetical protein
MVARSPGKTPADAYRPALEATLVDALAGHIADGFAGRRNWQRVHRELVVGSSVADLVLLSGGKRSFTFPSPLSVSESVVLAVVRRQDGSMTSEDLAALGDGRDIQRTVRRLVLQGVLRETEHGVRAPKRWWISGALYAIEAKLVRWRDALDQAVRYRGFADASFVALPEAYACAAMDGEREFKQAGVGLVLVTTCGLKRVIDATPATDHGWRREFAHSRLANTSA